MDEDILQGHERLAARSLEMQSFTVQQWHLFAHLAENTIPKLLAEIRRLNGHTGPVIPRTPVRYEFDQQGFLRDTGGSDH